ncbi:MAG: TonB-dependent receptor, partial [Gammaproteobacteria bacterium]
MKKLAVVYKCAFWVLVALAVTAIGTPLAVNATELEEIIVTAQKRSEYVQDVPIAVTTFTAESIEQRGLTNVSQLGDFTPNVEMDSTSPFAGSSSILSPYIRGIGQNDFAFNLEPGVGVYVDGVYYARTIGAVVDMLDLDHVEILKGPQGTLFGRNTIGGAINIITRKPGDEYSWKGEVTAGRYNRVDVRGAVDAPIIPEKLLSSLAFSFKNRNGYQDRIPFAGNFSENVGEFITPSTRSSGNESGDENQDNIRGKLLWLVNDDLEVTFSADYTRVDEQATPLTLLDTFADPTPVTGNVAGIYNTCISLPQATLTAIGLGPVCNTPIANTGVVLGGANVDADPNNDRLPYDDRFITSDIDTSFAAGSNYSVMDTFGGSATIDWWLENGMFVKSITAHRRIFAQHGVDFGGAPFTVGESNFDTK